MLMDFLKFVHGVSQTSVVIKYKTFVLLILKNVRYINAIFANLKNTLFNEID